MPENKNIFFRGFTLFPFIILFFAFNAYSSEDTLAEEKFNPGELITHHIGDSHVWHLWEGHYGTIPLPVILYSSDRGIEMFSSGNFYDSHHALKEYNGYKLIKDHIVPIDA